MLVRQVDLVPESREPLLPDGVGPDRGGQIRVHFGERGKLCLARGQIHLRGGDRGEIRAAGRPCLQDLVLKAATGSWSFWIACRIFSISGG